MKRIYLCIFITILSFMIIPIVSAWNFDNSLRYENNDMKVNLENAKGLPIIGSDLGTMELKSHKSVNEILNVGLGKQVTMFYDFNFKELYKNGLGDVTFTNPETGEEVEKDWRFVYWGDKIVNSVECSKEEDVMQGNGESIRMCTEYKDIETIEKGWIPYISKNIPNTEIRIGIEVDCIQGEYLDGVWDIAGKKVKKHAEWTADLNTNIVAYYKLDNDDLTDEVNSYDGANTGSTNSTGIVVSGRDFSGSGQYITVSDTADLNFGTGAFTINFWADMDTVYDHIMFKGKQSASWNGWLFRTTTGDVMLLTIGGSGIITGTTDIVGTGWHMITWVRSAGGVNRFYVNGTQEGGNVTNAADLSYANDLFIGKEQGFGADYDGRIDEVGIWKGRDLNPTEIQAIYQANLDGNSYTSSFGSDAPIVNLNTPIDTYNSTASSTITFNFTASDDINLTNVTLIFNGVDNQTNTSGINNSIYLFELTLPDGNYNWTARATDNESQSTTATVRTFSVDTSDPVVTIIYPTATSYNTNITIANYIVNEAKPDRCWYSMDGGTTNSSDVSSGTNFTGIASADGDNTITIFCNDTSSRVGSSEVTYNVDIPPFDWTNGVVAHYGFEETSGTLFPDSTGNNNGTIMGGVGKINTGIIGNAYNFTVGGAYVNISTSLSVDDMKDNYSVSLWVNTRPKDQYSNDFIHVHEPASYRTWAINQPSYSDAVYGNFTTEMPTGNSETGTWRTNTKIVNDTWQHIVVTHNDTVDMYYVQGELVATRTANVHTTTDDQVMIGNAWDSTAIYYMNGKMDEITFFNRTVSPSEVTSLFNGGSALGFGETGESDTTAPTWVTIPADTSETYNVNWSGVLFVATDETLLDTYFINDSRFSINSTGFLDESYLLGVGFYAINISVNDTSGNENSTIFVYEVTQANPSIGITGTTPIIYETTTDVSGTDCPSQLTCSLDKSNGIFGVGIETFNYSTSGNENYTSDSITKDITINQNARTFNIAFNETSPIYLGNVFLAFSNCSTDFTMYRNTTLISNNSEQSLLAGVYNFTVYRTDQSNYSFTIAQEDFIVEETIPPVLIANATSPTIVYNNTDWVINLTGTNNLAYISAWTKFYIDGATDGIEHFTNMSNNTNTQVATLVSGNFSKGMDLIAEVKLGDARDNSTAVNLTSVTVQNSIPTNPSGSSITAGVIRTGMTITGTGSGSTDLDNDAITYLYQFYNENSTTIVQAYSTDNTYVVQTTDAHDIIRVNINASTSDANSTGGEEFTKVITDDSPHITINLPANVTNITSSSLNVNATGIFDDVGIASVSVYLDGVLNQTNSSGINNSLYNFALTGLSNGLHNWSISVTDNISQTNTTEVRWFNVSVASLNYSIVINLNSPADSSISVTNSIVFNITANSYNNITNVSLWTNESGSWGIRNTTTIPTSLNESNLGTPDQTTGAVTGKDGMKFLVKSSGISIKSLLKISSTTATNCYLLNSSKGVIASSTFTGDKCTFSSPILLTNEDDYYVAVDSGGASYTRSYRLLSSGSYAYPTNRTFINWTDGLNDGADEATFFADIISVELVYPTTDITTTFNRTILSDIIWNAQVCDYTGYCNFSDANYSLFLDTTIPTIDIESPSAIQNYGKIGNEEILNVTFTHSNLDTCWYSYNGVNTTINGCVSGVKNSTTFTLVDGVTSLTAYANNSVGSISSEVVNFEYLILENNRSYNTTSYETAYDTYSINVTANSSLTGIALLFNSTSYTMSNQGSGIWTYSRDTPTTVIGNNSIQFRFTYGGGTINSSASYQNILPVNLTYCTSGTTYLNLTFKDESDDSVLNATIPTSTFEYYLGTGTETKTLTYVNTTEHFSYAFCVSPSNVTLNIDQIIQYSNTGYPQRTYEPATMAFTNTTTNTTLYLLSSSDGLYVTFQVLGSTGTPLSGVDVDAKRDIGSTATSVGHGTTDAAGSVTLWMNPDFEHNITFIKSGYDVYNYITFPTQSLYTINLGTSESSSGGETQHSRGIYILIKPSKDFINSNTIYNFNYTISTDYWELQEWGFSMLYKNGTIISTNTSTSDSGGTLNIQLNTTDQTKLIMQYFYNVNGSQINGTRYWLTQSANDFSIKHFFGETSDAIDEDIFGVQGDDEGGFTKALISVLVLISIAGTLSYRYGIQSEAAIMGIVFGVVALLNILNFIPNPDFLVDSAISLGDFVTFVVLVILIGFIFKEEGR